MWLWNLFIGSTFTRQDNIMTEIIWINCADQMPPDDGTRYIFTNLIYNVEAIPLIYTGHYVNMLGFLDGDAWTLYTEEKWKELNKWNAY